MTYANIKAELARTGVTQSKVASFMGMTGNNLSLKLNERIPLTVHEAKKIRSRFFPEATLDYLLASDSDD